MVDSLKYKPNMKNLILLFCVIALSCVGAISSESAPKVASVPSQENQTTEPNKTFEGFRGFEWGVSKEKVQEQEKAKSLSENSDSNSLSFEDKINSNNFLLLYIFTPDNKLARGRYGIYEKFSNKTKYITAYSELLQSLTEKYGKPKKIRNFNTPDLFKDDLGSAVSFGYSAASAVWETSNSLINLFIQGNNGDTQIVLNYESKELAKVLDSESKSKNSNKL
jgi:hypothetical protein